MLFIKKITFFFIKTTKNYINQKRGFDEKNTFSLHNVIIWCLSYKYFFYHCIINLKNIPKCYLWQHYYFFNKFVLKLLKHNFFS